MSLTPFSSPNQSPTVLVDQMIGTAFPVVKTVAEAIEFVKHVSKNLPALYTIFENIEEIEEVRVHLNQIIGVFAILTSIIDLHAELAALTELDDNLAQLLELNTNTTVIINSANYVATVAAQFGNVETAINAAEASAQVATANAALTNADRIATAADRTVTGQHVSAAAGSAAAALTAKLGAETAAAAAAVSGALYVDIATGRAAVADTALFKVVGTSPNSIEIYRRDSVSTQTLLATVPSMAALTSLQLSLGVTTTGILSSEINEGKMVGVIDTDGALRIKSVNAKSYEKIINLKTQLGQTEYVSVSETLAPNHTIYGVMDTNGVFRITRQHGLVGIASVFGATSTQGQSGSLPIGGLADQIIVKKSGTNGDTLWGPVASKQPSWENYSGVPEYPQDRWFLNNGATLPQYGLATGPHGQYFADIDQTISTAEGWDAQRQTRGYYVRAYSHSLRKASDIFLIGTSAIVNDDHSVPAICRDHNGYFHVFGGSHTVPMYHWRSVRPNDITEWVFVDRIGSGQNSYQHPNVIGGKIYLFARKYDNAFGFDLVLYTGIVGNNGAVTWSGASIIIHFDPASPGNRVYAYKPIIRGNFIDIMFTRSRFVDTTRENIYFASFDTTVLKWVSLIGTGSTAQIIESTATSTFKLITTPGTDDFLAGFDFCWDAINPDLMHMIWFDPSAQQMKYRTYTLTVNRTVATVSADTILSTSVEVRPQQGISPYPSGGCILWYRELDVAFSSGGNIYRRNVINEKVGPAAIVARPEDSFGLSQISPIRDAHIDALITVSARTDDSITESGEIKTYILGNKGPLWISRIGCNIWDQLGNEIITNLTPSGAELSLLTTLAGATTTPVLSIEAGTPFDISANGYLVTNGAVANGSYYPVIEAKDSLGQTIAKKNITIKVASSGAYTFNNADAANYVARTCRAWSTAHQLAIDTFTAGLVSAGIYSKFDVLVPPNPKLPYAGRHQLKGLLPIASLVHGSQPIVFDLEANINFPVPATPWKTSGIDNYVNTQYNPTTFSGAVYAQDSASVFIRARESIAGTGAIIGFESGGNGTSIKINSASVSARINQATASVGTILTTNRAGLFSANRSAAGAVQLYRNGVALTMTSGATETSIAPVNGAFRLGYAGPTDGYVEASWDGYGAGSSLTAGEWATFWTLWTALETAFGLSA